jgi:hypothetical protein
MKRTAGTPLINREWMRCARLGAAARREKREYPSWIFERRATRPRRPRSTTRAQAFPLYEAGSNGKQSSPAPARSFLLSSFSFVLLSLLVCSCAGGRNFHAIPAEGPPNVPRYLELRSSVRVATMHFPAGTYSLCAEDSKGYYYCAPHKIAEHTSGTSIGHDGGIYVSKRSRKKLRGYVYWGGARTHLGNLSRAKCEFHD